ncbi:hypothetical protein GCM10023321_80720 [Pseudonocardia eucalypti]|uniref:Uncharacterized protein n=1 Tax=Pseudonocardia eucalypti TaxID=648755 RepID=A0ABP9RDJ9_9PSEU|nr:hypothetical protein [Pseudonocardia eucalypti]
MRTSQPSGRRAGADFRRTVQTLLYESFRHAQGDQRLQIHFIESYARILREQGVSIDPAVRDELVPRIRSRRLPRGHLAISNRQQVAAQFEFWWLTLWDLLVSVYAEDSRHVPSSARLADRMVLVGGTTEMSSFTPAEMRQIDEGLAPYRDQDDPAKSSAQIIWERFLPNLIRVEWNFQGNGARYPARPRTDGGDIHESKMLGYCDRAAAVSVDQASDPVNQIYLEVSRSLAWLAAHRPQDPTYAAYTRLIASYRANHQRATATLGGQAVC